MVKYVYVCRTCGHEKTLDLYYSADELTAGVLRCEARYAIDTLYQGCRDEACLGLMRRKFAVGGIVFKGSGFYSTDKKSDG